MSYLTQRDKLTGKDVVVAYDFPNLETRFVTDRSAAGLSHPPGWTVFSGAMPEAEDGSTYDAKTGRLQVGGQSFWAPDLDETVTAWLKDHDSAGLARATVVMRAGFRGTPEAEWPGQQLVLEDYEVQGRHGGGYRFVLGNVLAAMSAGLFESVSGGSLSLDTETQPSGLDVLATTIVLSGDPSDWPASGYALLSDTDAKLQEIVRYGAKAIVGEKWALTGVERRVFGVGQSPYVFPVTGNTSITAVWVLRGGVGELALRTLTTTDAAGASTPAAVGSNPFLEDWISDTNLDGWVENIGAGTIAREDIEHVCGFSAVKMVRTVAGTLSISRAFGAVLTPGKWYRLTVLAKAGATFADGLGILVSNSTQNVHLDDDGTGTVWTGSATLHAFDLGVDVRRATIVFRWDPGFPGGDGLSVQIHNNTGGTASTVWVDAGPGPILEGPFDSAPNGPYDAGDGDGLGIDVDFMNIDHAENILAAYWPHPAFDNAGRATSGDAALFVESDSIDNVREWVEELLRSFGLRPVVDSLGRWSLDKLFRVPPTNIAIGEEWVSQDYRPKWSRSFADAVNSVTFGSDWNAAENEYDRQLPAAVDDDSVDAFGKSEPIKLETRGLRTGRLGFPDLNGETIARKAATRILLELANPSTPIEIDAFLKYKDVSLLNTVTVLIRSIPDLQAGTRQTTPRTFHMVRVAQDLARGVVRLRIRERRTLNRPAIVGPNSLAGVTYDTATEGQREFCFVAPDESGFADGSLPYTVPP
jgi:hypothetical protein